MGKTALLIGATGLVGSTLLELLLRERYYQKIIAPTRRPLGKTDSRLENPIVKDMVDLDSLQSSFEGADLFFCFGTTRKKAGSSKAFEDMEKSVTQNIFHAASGAEVKKILMVSSIGANPKSSNTYLRVKGELEGLAKITFETVHIFRPSFLVGDRKESRFFEALALKIIPHFDSLLVGTFNRYRSTDVHVLGKKLLSAARSEKTGVFIHENEEIR